MSSPKRAFHANLIMFSRRYVLRDARFGELEVRTAVVEVETGTDAQMRWGDALSSSWSSVAGGDGTVRRVLERGGHALMPRRV